MKRTRKLFLLTAAATGVGLALAPPAIEAQTGATGAPAAPPSPAPAASATPPPSAAARSMAARIGRFQPDLTPKQLEDIAAGIEQIYGFGDVLNPKGTKLKNGDAPLPLFEVP